MAELETDCCPPATQARCCEPEQKTECCDEHHGAGCRCAGRDSRHIGGTAASHRSETAQSQPSETARPQAFAALEIAQGEHAGGKHERGEARALLVLGELLEAEPLEQHT
jgi:hypothetical protein